METFAIGQLIGLVGRFCIFNVGIFYGHAGTFSGSVITTRSPETPYLLGLYGFQYHKNSRVVIVVFERVVIVKKDTLNDTLIMCGCKWTGLDKNKHYLVVF